MAEWLSSWLAEQEDRGSIPGLATWIFRDWLSPASKSRYGWKIAKSTLILKTTNQPTTVHCGNHFIHKWTDTVKSAPITCTALLVEVGQISSSNMVMIIDPLWFFENNFGDHIIIWGLSDYYKRGYFRLGKISQNLGNTFHVGVIFTILLLFPKMSHLGFIFAWGKFLRRMQYRGKHKNYPHMKISTFTVFVT